MTEEAEGADNEISLLLKRAIEGSGKTSKEVAEALGVKGSNLSRAIAQDTLLSDNVHQFLAFVKATQSKELQQYVLEKMGKNAQAENISIIKLQQAVTLLCGVISAHIDSKLVDANLEQIIKLIE